MKNLRVHPVTWLFLLLLLFTGFASIIIPYLIAITLHELGHAYVAKKLGYKLNKIWILPYGACISFDEFSFDPNDEMKIAFAGPLVNIILIVVTVMSWWLFPAMYVYTYVFTLANFSIAAINLLPAFPLDGGRIMTSALRKKFRPQKVYKIACTLNLIFSIIFLILFFISCFFTINFSLGLMGIFLFLGIIDTHFQGKYGPLLYEFNNKNKDIQQVNNICLNSSTPFYKILTLLNKHKYNLIYVKFPDESLKMVTEKQFNIILKKHSLESCFDNLNIKE